MIRGRAGQTVHLYFLHRVKNMTTEVSLSGLARKISADWIKVNYAARPYLDAMLQMSSTRDMYGYDDGKSIVLYFLANAGSWRGPVAREIKAQLREMVQ